VFVSCLVSPWKGREASTSKREPLPQSELEVGEWRHGRRGHVGAAFPIVGEGGEASRGAGLAGVGRAGPARSQALAEVARLGARVGERLGPVAC
jgi:hypothetical protein